MSEKKEAKKEAPKKAPKVAPKEAPKATKEAPKEAMQRVYHYTTPANAAKIKEENTIKPSVAGAFGGNKVYVTSMPPTESKGAIARNNYDDGAPYWETKESQGSVDDHIALDVPKSLLTKEDSSRDIYTIKGEVKVDKSKK